jgi:DNA-binding MarR family transcriptional regulator
VDESLKKAVDSLAEDIRDQSNQLEINTFLSLLYTLDVTSRYVDMETAKHTMRLKGYNLSRAGYYILDVLILNGGTLIPTEISKKIFRSKHTVTIIIDTLEKWGLVKREDAETDRRMKNISITEEGVDLVRKTSFSRGRKNISHQVLLPVDKKQMEMLNQTLKLIRKHVNALVQKQGASLK